MDVVQLTQSLIAFDTVSPPGNEEDCARYIADFLKDLHAEGASVELHKFAPRRANVIATFRGDSPGLLLGGHIDVVPPGDLAGWTSPPFEGKVRNGKLFGRGAVDMKGGVAAMMAAVEAARRRKLKRSLTFVATAGEEVGFDGLRAAMKAGKLEGVSAVCGLVGEPTDMRVVRGHRGGLTIEVKVHGKSAHSSDPSVGVNAVEKTVEFIEKLQPLRRELAKVVDPDLGQTLVTPTVIEGGTKSNVIPASCTLTLDIRTVPGITRRTVLEGLNAIVQSIHKKDRDFKADLQVLYDTLPLAVPATDKVVKLAEEITGTPSTIVLYGTEAPEYCKLGVPTVVLGPGSIKEAHTYDEFVPLEQLKLAESVYGKFVDIVCK